MRILTGLLALALTMPVLAGEDDFPHRNGNKHHKHMVHAYEHPLSSVGHNHDNYRFVSKRMRLPSERRILTFPDGRQMITQPQPAPLTDGVEFADSAD